MKLGLDLLGFEAVINDRIENVTFVTITKKDTELIKAYADDFVRLQKELGETEILFSKVPLKPLDLGTSTNVEWMTMILGNRWIFGCLDEKGKFSGYIQATFLNGWDNQPTTMVWIDDLIIERRFRGKGIAEKLFNAFVKDTKILYPNITYVKCRVHATNQQGLRYYTKLGFKPDMHELYIDVKNK